VASKLEQLLEEHREEYDRDCSVHNGCACGWEPESEFYEELENEDDPYSFNPSYPARDEYTEHLTTEIRRYLQNRPLIPLAKEDEE